MQYTGYRQRGLRWGDDCGHVPSAKLRSLTPGEKPTRRRLHQKKRFCSGICDGCLKEQKPSERYFCEHSKRLAVFSEGYWETIRDVEAENLSTKLE